MSDGAMAAAHFDEEGPPAPLVDSQNSPRSLMRVCGRTTAQDGRIDDAWQAMWAAEPGRSAVIGASEVAAHYSGASGSAAVDAIKHRLTCRHYSDRAGLTLTLVGRLAPATAPGADNQFGFCATSSPTLFECTLILSRGAVAAALTVTGTTESGIDRVISKLSPALADAAVAAATGRTARLPGSSAAPTTTALAPAVGRTWTKAEAQQHLIAMAQSFDASLGPVPIQRLLAESGISPADLLTGVKDYADQYQGRVHVFAENLGAGRWPRGARAKLAALAAAAREDAAAYAAVERAADVPHLRARFAAAQRKDNRTRALLREARAALGLPN